MRKLWSPAGLAIFFCLAGCALLFFPWAEAQVVTFDPAAPQTPPPKGTLSYVTMYGFQLWGGLASAAAFLTALVLLEPIRITLPAAILAGFFEPPGGYPDRLLVNTSPLQPTPAWRGAALLACGGAALAAAVGLIAWPPEALRSSGEAGRMVVVLSWGYAHLAALGLAGGLVLLGALELRQWVGRRLRAEAEAIAPSPAEPNDEADRGP
jgi:hypothetical protein